MCVEQQSDSGTQVDHPDDANYKSLHCGLRTLDRSSHEFKA